MPIIKATTIHKNVYRITLMMNGVGTNIVVSEDGLYNIRYIFEATIYDRTGRILGIVFNENNIADSYILFDDASDQGLVRERIYTENIQSIVDVTPNNAYVIAVKHGFQGSESAWLQSLRGNPGKDAYEIAIEEGFTGTRKEWLDSLKGKDAFNIAVEHGFEGNMEDWMATYGDTTAIKGDVDSIQSQLQWSYGMT